MTIKQLQYMLDDLSSIITNGGSDYKKASKILNSEATTSNIKEALDLIAANHNKLRNNK